MNETEIENNNNNDKLLFSTNEFKKKLFERINGISSIFNVAHPINPKIRYEYPPLNEITLENIINALISCPKFYIQTLHLMNKMNLPCPLVSFIRMTRSSLYNQQIDKDSNKQEQDDQELKKHVKSSSASSSEYESEIEIDKEFSEKQIKDNSLEFKSKPPKKLKVKAFKKFKDIDQKSNESNKKIGVNEVFEKLDKLIEKSINKGQFKIVTEQYDREIIQSETDGFAKIIPIHKKLEDFQENNEASSNEKEIIENNKFIKKSDLVKKRLKLSELKELPVYKKYEKGEPNSRIYLKNLGKSVIESDLKFIYGRYIDWNNETHVNSFDIRLMQEGRMKGQAFITLPNEQMASKALSETHGYMLKEKPIIISFARSAKPK